MCSVHLHVICSISVPHYHFIFLRKRRAKSSAAGVEAFACISGCAAVFMTPLLFRKPFLWIRKGRPTTLYFQKEIMSKHFAAYRIHKSCNNWQHLGVLSDETFHAKHTTTNTHWSEIPSCFISESKLLILIYRIKAGKAIFKLKF